MRPFLPTVLLLFACGDPEVAPAPPPMQLTITPTLSSPGDPVQITVLGAPPNGTVVIATSTTGSGSGPCPPALGGACVELLPPISRVATLTADPAGAITTTIPAPPILDTWAVQALAPQQTDSQPSNVALLRTQPANNPPDPPEILLVPPFATMRVPWTGSIVSLSDPDGDPVSVSCQWQHAEALPFFTDIPGMTGLTRPSCLDANLPLGTPGSDTNCYGGDYLTLRCTASDGASTTSASAPESFVLSSAPEILSVELQPASPTDNDDIVALVDIIDVDLDPIRPQYRWLVNGVFTGTGRLLDRSLSRPLDEVRVMVSARDPQTGILTSYLSDAVIIQ